MRRFSGWTLCLTSILALAVVAGCAPKSPEERVAELRANYEADLNGFTLKSQPVEPPAADETAEPAAGQPAAPPAGAGSAAGAAGTDATADAGAATDEMAIEELPVTSDVVLDILIRNKGREVMPGLTLDVSQVDAQKAEKAHYRIWVDTSSIVRGPGTQVTKVLEGVDYEEGDGFQVEVRQPVPPEDRGEYGEFAGAS